MSTRCSICGIMEELNLDERKAPALIMLEKKKVARLLFSRCGGVRGGIVIKHLHKFKQALRTVLHVSFMLATVIGIPRLAHSIRDWATPGEPAANFAQAAQSLPETSPAPTMPELAVSRDEPVSLMPIRISLHLKETSATAPIAPETTAPSVPPTSLPVTEAAQPAAPARRELVSSIKRELTRLGFYDGPDSGAWSKVARTAARKFCRVNGLANLAPRPTLELLVKLQAALPPVEPETEGGEDVEQTPSAIPAQMAEVPSASPSTSKLEVPVAEEDYLPPWEARKTIAGRNSDQGVPIAFTGPVPENSQAATNSPKRRRRHVAHAESRRGVVSRYRESGRRERRRVYAEGFGWTGL